MDTEKRDDDLAMAVHHLREVIHALDIESVVTGNHYGPNVNQKVRDAFEFLVALDNAPRESRPGGAGA